MPIPCLAVSLFLLFFLALPSTAEIYTKELSPPGLQNECPQRCREHLAKAHGKGEASIEGALKKEMSDYRTLAERALTLRAETIKVGWRIREEMERGKPVSGEELALLNQGIVEHLALLKELFSVAESHECWLDMTDQELKALGMTPETRLRGVMLSLSSALVLYDNYLLAISLFEGDGKLRRILNESDPGYAVNSEELAKVTMSYNSVANRERVRRAMRFYERESKKLKPMLRDGGETDYINTLIVQSPSYTMVRKWSPFYVVGRHVGFLGAVTSDTLTGFEKTGVNLFSMVFGNAVGLVETRKGKLYGKGDVIKELKGTLAAGDILLEKTPFRLTDKLIPGYWGHAAVWIGTESELKELGIWDHPVVARYRDEIREGRLVVEALRSGVEMNSLEHFLNIDSIGIMREPDLDPKERAATVIRALRQVGKPYDFNFDVESKERVYCSKLVYLCYGGIDWPTKKSLGRATFTPDDVAVKSVRGGKLRLVPFYHDGKRVNEKPLEQMAGLMGAAAER
jgi:uncharacterized protein YycO